MNPSRPRGPHSREQNYVLPERCFPRIATLVTVYLVALPIQSCGRMALGLLHVGNGYAKSPIAGLDRCRIPSRSSRISDQHPGLVAINGCAATFNSLRRNDPWQDATQDCAESLGFAASIIGSRHGNHDGGVDVSEAGKEGPEAGSENECCG